MVLIFLPLDVSSSYLFSSSFFRLHREGKKRIASRPTLSCLLAWFRFYFLCFFYPVTRLPRPAVPGLWSVVCVQATFFSLFPSTSSYSHRASLPGSEEEKVLILLQVANGPEVLSGAKLSFFFSYSWSVSLSLSLTSINFLFAVAYLPTLLACLISNAVVPAATLPKLSTSRWSAMVS
ncbi:hypothetical protein B0J18DRAFT_89144 [Chaetomium sp. MPI-SDFR-AT-0129]|nr:hypothetical protein B0J18DRAFT_89144 [Chaetomium sp. MPI-SDFR-AT-0129]